MSNNQNYSIFQFAKWLTTKYLQLEKKTFPHPCRLTELVEKNGKILANIQFCGHPHLMEVDPEKLVQENLFEYFSPEDKKKIFSATYNKERLKLTARYYCREKNQEMIVLTDIVTGNEMTLSINTLSSDEEKISLINPKDSHRIGFMSGLSRIKNILSS